MGENGHRAPAELSIQISPVMEREFKRRHAFPELRLDNATRIVNGATGVYTVTIERAREILADARVQRCNYEIPPGVRKAYTALAYNIDRELQAYEAQREGHPDLADNANFLAVPRDDVEDDDDWPPAVSHNAAIEIGDGSRWHYRASAQALLLEGVLDAKDIPGNPACRNSWYSWGGHDGKLFQATRLGKLVAVTLLARNANIIRCPPLKFKAR